MAGLLLGTLCMSAGAGAPGQESEETQDPSPVERGRQMYGQACIQCHDPNYVLIQRKTEEEWRRTVHVMILRGAHVFPDEVESITAYLTATYGPSSPPPVLGEGDGSSEGTARPPGEGGPMIVTSCSQCHAPAVVFNSSKSEADWRETITRMRSYGASVSDPEEQVLVDYLTEHFGLQ